jgi:hypothetical protein
MRMSVTFIGRLCGSLATKAQALALATPALAPTIGPAVAKLQADTAMLGNAWSDMAIRNLLSDLLRSVLAIRTVLSGAGAAAVASKLTTESRGASAPKPLIGRARSDAVSGDNADLGVCRSLCAELVPRIETELAEHSPTKAKYSYVSCIGYKVKVAGAHYTGETDDAADMLVKCNDMKAAIRAAYSLADRNGQKYNNYVNMLKVFVAPEFYFRGRKGAYDHAVVHGGEQRTDVSGRVVKRQHKGIAEIMREELDKPQYKDWLFVLGTAIAATKLTETVCTACGGKIAFDRNPGAGTTTPRCTASKAHRVAEKVVGAQVENVGLIFKNGEFHTVTKELVSGIDYVDGASKNKVKLGSETHDVVTDARPSGYNAATDVPTKFNDERMGGCIFTIDGITIGVEVCLDHAATSASGSSGRLSHAGNIQLQLIPSAGMTINSLSTIPGGVVFNVDGLTPHVEAIGGTSAFRVQSTRYDGWTFSPTDRAAADWSGTDMDKLNKVQALGRGTWANTGGAAPSAAAGNGSVVMYGPYALPRL